MADPVTITSLALTAAGAATSAYGAYSGGQAQKNMYNYQAGVAGLNQKIAEQNADFERAQGEVQATEYGMKARYQQGQIRADQGASGLDVNSGSAAQVQAGQHLVSQMDLNQIRFNAARRAFGYETQAAQDTAQGQVYQMAGTNAATAGDISATASILSGAGSVANKWYQGTSTGNIGGANSGPKPWAYIDNPSYSNTGGFY